MVSPDMVQRSISRTLDSLDFKFEWEDYASDRSIQEVLSIASKNGKGNVGRPDHIYINNEEKLLILIEDKNTMSLHKSEGIKETEINSAVKKAILNSQIVDSSDKVDVFSNDSNLNPEGYAFDGILWYLSFFKKSNIQNELVRDYLSDWVVIGIAISGEIDQPYNHIIDTVVLNDDTFHMFDQDQLLNESEYIELSKNIVEETLIQTISVSSKKINNQLRNIESQRRPVILSALMICLFNHSDPDIDNSFIRDYKRWPNKLLLEQIPNRVRSILEAEGIISEKINSITQNIEFMQYEKTLVDTDIVKNILDELRVNVISKFTITSNYDIIGRFYEEFLRYAGVTNVKNGIVLTPHHITTLFTDLIPIEHDDVFLDPACGTGAFLIAGMNSLLKINQNIQDTKTRLLLDELEKIEDSKLTSYMDYIKIINERIDEEVDEEEINEKYIFSDTEIEEILNQIARNFEKGINEVIRNVRIVRNEQSERIYNEVKNNQLVGFEIDQTMYSLSVSNMMFRGDGKSNILQEDFFSEKSDRELSRLEEKGIKPTIGFVNPPYGGKDSETKPTKKEIQFFMRLINNVEKYALIICPISTFIQNSPERNLILRENKLLYVINMPSDLFQPNAATDTAIAVLEVGTPHEDHETVFYNLKDDGFVLSKGKGRTNVAGKWEQIREDLLDKLFNPTSEQNTIEREKQTYYLTHTVEETDEWIIQDFAKTDYTKLTTNNFINAIKSDIIYRVKRDLELYDKDMNELTMSEIIVTYADINFSSMDYEDEDLTNVIVDWEPIAISSLFERPLERGKCSKASDLKDGDDLFYLGAKKKDGGIIRKVTIEEDLVSTGPCLVFITDGQGSIGTHNYVDLEEFIGTTNLTLGYSENLNRKNALFLVTILDLEREKYSFGRKYASKIPNTKILLPVIKDEEGNKVQDAEGNFIPDWNFMEEFIEQLPYAEFLVD